MIAPAVDAVVRHRRPAPPVFTTRAVVPVDGGGVGDGVGVGDVGGTVGVGVGWAGWLLIARYWADAHPLVLAHVTGTHPFCVAPRTGTLAPSGSTVMIAPDRDAVARQRRPAPPVFTTVAVVIVDGGCVGVGVVGGGVGVGTGVVDRILR
jgi:hypothetical protein